MAKPYRIPDFKKMYPEASEEVIAVLKTTERKMQYQEYDLKVEQTIIDEEKQTVIIVRFLYQKSNWTSILRQGLSLI